MATLTLRNVPDHVRDRLRRRAADHGRSMEAEARAVLAQAMADAERPPIAARARQVQEAFAPYRLAGRSVVDELIAERRIEAQREMGETRSAKTPDHDGG